MEREWHRFYCHQKRPRVSYDKSKEVGVRSTRWLQLPYWLTTTLMIISTVMHWLTSETMFVVEFYQSELGLQSHFGINYSPLLFLLSVYC